jgi:hypothetical protein
MELLLGRTFPFRQELWMTSLRQRLTQDMPVRNFSPHTQACYLPQISQFAR